jgi:hypothetical protein
MGIYYDIVCPKHREVLRLWKAGSLWSELEYLVGKKELSKERVEPDSAYTKFIVVEPSAFKIIIDEKPKAENWLLRHKTCKLFFLDSEYADTFNYYDAFVQVNAQ